MKLCQPECQAVILLPQSKVFAARQEITVVQEGACSCNLGATQIFFSLLLCESLALCPRSFIAGGSEEEEEEEGD